MNSKTPAQPARSQAAGREPAPSTKPLSRLAELLMIKPKWRGWIHTVTAPLALAAGIVLVLLAPTADRKITSAVYAATGVLLFGISAVYHRGNWSPGVRIGPEAARPHQHHAGHRRQLHTAGLVPAGTAQGRAAALGHLVRRHPGGAVPAAVDACAALAVRADLHRAGLRRAVLPAGVFRGQRSRCHPDLRGRRSSTSPVPSSTPSRSRTSATSTSASTNCSTRSRCLAFAAHFTAIAIAVLS